MKKYFNKKSILLAIALIYVFFAGFKFFKGKSFFDTIVEYTNNIYSVNAEIVDATRDNYSLLNFEYIPMKYIDYREASFGRYIARKADTNNLYIYEPITKEENLFVEISDDFNLHDVVVDDNWVIWLESNNNSINEGIQGIVWRIYAKMINSEDKILVEQGTVNDKKDKGYMNFIPREFELEGNTLVYAKYGENTINKNNIITTTMMTSIVKYDLEKKESMFITTSYNNYKEELSDIQMNGDNVIWQKKYKDIKTGATTKTEIYKYSIKDASIETIFETSEIYRIDIKGDNIAIVVKNPEDNILIYNIKEKSFTNIFYKGSRIEKMLRSDDNIPVIINVEFITSKTLFIGISSKKEDISAVMYDLNLKEFLNFDNEILEKENVSLIQYGITNNKLLAYVGVVDKTESKEKDKDLYSEHEDNQLNEFNQREIFIDVEGINLNLDEENKNLNQRNLYYKYFEYLIR